MKKTMWKWKAVLTLLVCMIAVGGNWSGCKVQAETYTIDDTTGFEYEIVNNAEIKITGRIGNPTDIIIPDQIEELPVTSVGDSAFSECRGLTSITIPNSVTSIGNYAFDLCNSLTSIAIPDRLTNIGDWAFHGCDSLTNITFPDSVTSIGDGAFILAIV